MYEGCPEVESRSDVLGDLHERTGKFNIFPYYCEFHRKFEFFIFLFFLSANENMLNNLILINEYDLHAYAENGGKLHIQQVPLCISINLHRTGN